MKNLLVIHELDYSDNERSVIGVADSVENANALIKDYYRDFKEISFRDIRDSNLEFEKVIELKFSPTSKETYQVRLTLEWFTLNKA